MSSCRLRCATLLSSRVEGNLPWSSVQSGESATIGYLWCQCMRDSNTKGLDQFLGKCHILGKCSTVFSLNFNLLLRLHYPLIIIISSSNIAFGVVTRGSQLYSQNWQIDFEPLLIPVLSQGSITLNRTGSVLSLRILVQNRFDYICAIAKYNVGLITYLITSLLMTVSYNIHVHALRFSHFVCDSTYGKPEVGITCTDNYIVHCRFLFQIIYILYMYWLTRELFLWEGHLMVSLPLSKPDSQSCTVLYV